MGSLPFAPVLAWWQWAIVLAVPPLVVLLYFLKLRRQPLEVPSTYLWSRTIEDLHVNSLWQRLRNSLLLFLQLALLAMMILALLGPGYSGTKLQGDRFIVLIDTSASMSATDVAPSRLAEARQRAYEIVEKMNPGDVAMVIACNDTATILQEFTDSRAALRRAIAAAEPTERPSDLTEAVAAAAGVANPIRSGQQGQGDILAAGGEKVTLYIISDGSVPPVSAVSVGENLTVRHLPIGSPEAVNTAITALAVGKNPERLTEYQVFASIDGFGGSERTVDATLYRGETILDAAAVAVAPGQSTGYAFALPTREDGTPIEGALRLELDVGTGGTDHLAVDDTAYLPINAQRQARVLLVSAGDFALEAALSTSTLSRISELTIEPPAFLETDAYRQRATTGGYDLVIYDRVVPSAMPQASTIFIGTAPPFPGWSVGVDAGPPVILATDRAHPLTQYLEMSNVIIERGRSIDGPPGTQTLIEADIGPLLAISRRSGFEDVVLGIPLRIEADGEERANTTWPTRASFPLFWQNAVVHLTGTLSTVGTEVVRPGEPIRLRMAAPVSEITVTDPAGRRQTLTRSGEAGFIHTGTEQRGTYTAAAGPADDTPRRFAVNLFDARESALKVGTIEVGDSGPVATESNWVRARRELWKFVALAALAILLIEWWLYHRRMSL